MSLTLAKACNISRGIERRVNLRWYVLVVYLLRVTRESRLGLHSATGIFLSHANIEILYYLFPFSLSYFVLHPADHDYVPATVITFNLFVGPPVL